MATVAYAMLTPKADVVGGTSGQVIAVGSVADLTSAGHTIDPANLGNTAAAIDDQHPLHLDIDVGWYYNTPTGSDPGWYTSPLLTANETVVNHVEILKNVVRSFEDAILPPLILREQVDPQMDSGHYWWSDLVNGVFKPWARYLQVKLLTELIELDNNRPVTLSNYQTDFETWQDIMDPTQLGMTELWESGDKTTIRPLRTGANARDIDASSKAVTGTAIPVTYPTGTSVQTWNMREAVEALNT